MMLFYIFLKLGLEYLSKITNILIQKLINIQMILSKSVHLVINLHLLQNYMNFSI